MKRYEPIEVVGPDGDDVAMEERPDGQWYHRADLIAAGVLVPVKDENDFATPVRLVPLEEVG